jgi:hypothetical protein
VSDQPAPATTWPKSYGPQDAPKEVLGLAHRLMTGVGFFVSFDVPNDVPCAVPAKFAGGNANIKVEGIPNGAGCVLFVDHGVIQMLEVYTYGTEEFPEHPVIVGVENAFPVSSYLRKTP